MRRTLFSAILLSSQIILTSAALPIFSMTSPPQKNSSSSITDRVGSLEKSAFGKIIFGKSLQARVTALEIDLLGTASGSSVTMNDRLKNLEASLGTSDPKASPVASPLSSPMPNASTAKAAESKEIKSDALASPQKPQADLASALAEAVSAYDKKQIEKARDMFEKAVSIDPTNADANFSLGCIAEDRGDFKRAVAYYEKARTTKPDDAEINAALKNVKEKLAKTPPPPAKPPTDDIAKSGHGISKWALFCR